MVQIAMEKGNHNIEYEKERKNIFSIVIQEEQA